MFIFQKGTFVRKKGGGGGCFFNFWGCVCLLALLAMMRRRKSAASMCSRGMIISWFAIFDQVPWNLVYFACMNFQSYFWFFLSFWNPTSPNFRAASYRRRSSPWWWCWTKVHQQPPKHLNFAWERRVLLVNLSLSIMCPFLLYFPSFCLFRFLLLQFVLPSFLLEGGFLVAQFVRIDLDPSNLPFICAMAFSASTFLVKPTKP